MNSLRWYHFVVILVIFGALCGGAWYAVAHSKTAAGDGSSHNGAPKAPTPVTVEVVKPRAGGIERVCVQPGTVEPFEGADLYAKASGYLVEQSVDIGSRVSAGDVLARIAVPEYEKTVERDAARVRDMNAKVKQMEAHLRAAQAEQRAAEAAVNLAAVMVKAKTAYKRFREKQLERVKGLVAERAESAKLLDEQEDFYQSAFEAENAAKENVIASKEKALAATAKVTQAEADVDEARADVGVAEAELARSKVLLEYTVIRAPYTGVVTKRNFHAGKGGRPGDFIKAADQGGVVPLLAVERTDLMRVVVQVPDRDVPYVSTTSTAVVEIDALPGVKFGAAPADKLKVSRWATAEDPATRTMRIEIDVPNPDPAVPNHILVHGMYGRVTIALTPGAPNAVRVPSAALVGKAGGGRGSVRVVRDGKAHLVPVQFATDNGIEVEVVAGLSPADQVVTRATGPLEEGAPVTVQDRGTAPGH
ncbi:efflux RND transporter periplasmic adaptor subunit [Frigoriglobus tundricola]|uniref:Multidrug resistance protein MdtA-like C-terminal permuted SH3 domain-containing protein n=1 Tax=Frigoriglobus tundricola TaxID=2774151 RepID=A0A6M5YR14_9BACT|nr:efflux RND transporter periplasmic adaptor subunit [Frigoriglobus tundricola]QJW95691.1 hypothetical protein FTUN_3245 [Frigoriglobus tundricola]